MKIDNKQLKSELKYMKNNLNSYGSKTDPINRFQDKEYMKNE